jgi:hypothetical protein
MAGAPVRKSAALFATIVATLTIALSTTARAATITVNSLADTIRPGVCMLRNAINAANTKKANNACHAGTGNDTILFSVTGTITLGTTLPQITDSNLTITGPASPGITIDGGGSKVQVIQIAPGATVTLSNLAIDGGGKVQVIQIASGATVTLSNLAIAHGIKPTNSAGGGGIDNGGILTATNSTFSANDSGGIRNEGTLTVGNSTFSANFEGGGIFNEGTLTVSNSTFSSNRGYGFVAGGISNYGGTLMVTGSTFSGNSTDYGVGGAVLNNGGEAIFKSTIVAANSGGANCAGTIIDAGYNISDDTSCGFSKTGTANNGDDVNPLLDPAGLANNGGPTETIALQPGSLAIDAIPLANCTDQASPPNPIITDQRLFPRPDTGEVGCDIGAYEVQDTAFVPFSGFGGALTLHQGSGVFYLSGGFRLGPGGSIDPATERAAFGIGSYAIRLPPGSFVRYNTGYVYQKTVNGIFLCIYIKFTSTPGSYQLLVYGQGGTLPTKQSPVTLTIGNDSGSTLFR